MMRSSVSSDHKDTSNNHPQLPHCFSIHILYHISCWYPLIWFSPSPAASAARHLLSSSAAEFYAALFASDLDSAIPKAYFLAFLIASPTGQSFEVTRECLMEPHRHRFFCFFSVDFSLWVIVPLPCWWYLFKTLSLTIFHPTSTCNHVIVYLLFDHCLLVEGSQSLDVISLIV